MLKKVDFKKAKLLNQNWIKNKLSKYKNQIIIKKSPYLAQRRNKSMQRQYLEDNSLQLLEKKPLKLKVKAIKLTTESYKAKFSVKNY